MNENIFFILLYIISFSFQIIIKDGVYILLSNNYYFQYNKKKAITKDSLKYPSSYFRINKANKKYYYLQILNTEYKLSYSRDSELIFIKTKNRNNLLNLWNIIKTKNESYVIQNQNNCFIKIEKFNNIKCKNISMEEASLFDIFIIYEEVKENSIDSEIIEKEPIDVLIKYIDLRDNSLKRSGIHQIEKDYDNEELRYSIRSIFMNIPWVRKIFILMPNDKVRYFKDYNLINKKIVYVKDRDLLGYDSSDINGFLFRYWKMKDFGISDNFIVMDDDCFIGKKLKKTDFFYVENGKVVPAITTTKFLKLEKISVEERYNFYKYKALNSKEEQNDEIFYYSLYLTYLLIMNIFKKDLIFIPKFTHNAIPVRIKELKEIYDIVNNSEYKSATLDSLYRKIGYVQFQEFFISYTFIKYHRKISSLTNRLIVINNSISSDHNVSLFCINKGPGNYSYLNLYKARLAMEYLFPIPTPFEINDYSIVNLSFNIIYSMENGMNLYEEQLNGIHKRIILFYFFFILLLFIFSLIIKYYLFFKKNIKKTTMYYFN